MSTSYELVKNNIFDPSFIPSADGNGILYLCLQLLTAYDATASIVATNPFQDVIAKIKAAVPESPLRREALALLEARSERYGQGL